MYKKKVAKMDPDNLYDEEYDIKEGEEGTKKKNKKDVKYEDKEKKKELMRNNKIQRILADCRFCLGNNQILEEQILSFSPSALLIIPEISNNVPQLYILNIKRAI